MYYTYMIRCEDNSIYTGITTDINRRVKEHINKTKKCAKYTKRHNAIKIEICFLSETRSLACKLEYAIKKLKREEKENIILYRSLEVLKTKLEINEYELILLE